MKLIKEIDLGYAKVQLFEPELIRVDVPGSYIISGVEAKEITEKIGLFSNGKETLVLMVGDELAQVDKEAREFSASADGLKYTLADAFVVKNLAQRILSNFYLKINKPSKPTKVFNDESEAIEWLFSIKEGKN